VVCEWGYATSNYFAPDHDLSFPRGFSAPRPNADLATLVSACHQAGIRFGYDAVMAFGQRDPYREINFLDFHVQWDTGDPEQDDRDGFGGDLFSTTTGPTATTLSGGTAGSGDDRFLVIGEELAVPVDLVRQGRLDALWNERFKRAVRCAILGQNDPEAPTFEETVQRMIDCRRLGFTDGAQAVNYVTSHDVEGFRNERLYEFLNNNRVVRTEERIKLAFACLLTAVGIPLILAGEEFADEHDLSVGHPDKQIDPVNFDRLDADPWRQRICTHVARLVQLRRRAPALGVNDTDFLHTDFTDGRRVLAWRRGSPGQDPVVVVANFSDWATPDPTNPASEYIVPNWPPTPPGRSWREVTQDRDVPGDWIGCEPLFAWEARSIPWPSLVADVGRGCIDLQPVR
jgi:pullulanase